MRSGWALTVILSIKEIMRGILIILTIAVLALAGSRSAQAHYVVKPAGQIQHGASTLFWLETHPQFGTKHSRAVVYRNHKWLLFEGLKRAGFYNGAICIHGFEGAWNDPGLPFEGGMQMDRGFQSTYGPVYIRLWGTADRWPIWAQLHASYKAWASGRGWYPWPNTARYCGLI